MISHSFLSLSLFSHQNTTKLYLPTVQLKVFETFTQFWTATVLFPANAHVSPKPSLSKCTTVLAIQTGVGASIGGYARDALPAARLLSTVTKHSCHPSKRAKWGPPVLTDPNAQYVEGYALDQFCASNLNLQPLCNRSNKIGLLLDSDMSFQE